MATPLLISKFFLVVLFKNNPYASREQFDEGTWYPGVLALRNFCEDYGYFTQDVYASQINQNRMENQFDVLIVPGGWTASYNAKIDSQGMENIRSFVRNGA